MILFGLSDLGAIEFDAVVLLMVLLYAGVSQLIAGIFAYYKKDMLSSVANLTFTFFWITFAFIEYLPSLG